MDFTREHVSRDEIETFLNLKINDPFYYQRALVQKSVQGDLMASHDRYLAKEYFNESNERLEFLGDSMFTSAVTFILFEKYTDKNEGEMSKMRTRIINGETMSYLAKKIGIGNYILASIDIQDPENNDRFLEDCFEALIGAIYLDLGFESVLKYTRYIINNFITDDILFKNKNYKDILIRFCKASKFIKSYKLDDNSNLKFISEKVDDKYHVYVQIYDIKYKTKINKNKKIAERDAAKYVLDELKITEELIQKLLKIEE